MTATTPDKEGGAKAGQKDATGSEAEKKPADGGPESAKAPEEVEEIGGPKGPEPTRYGDWEKGGRCSDF